MKVLSLIMNLETLTKDIYNEVVIFRQKFASIWIIFFNLIYF